MATLKNLMTALFWLCLMALIGSSPAIAAYSKADCLALAKVKRWTGTYSIIGSNTGSGQQGGSDYQWNYQSSWSGQITIENFTVDRVQKCTDAYANPDAGFLKEWPATGEITTSSGTITGTESITNGCVDGATASYQFSASGQPVPEPPIPLLLMLSLSNGTYTLNPNSGPNFGGVNPGELTGLKKSSCSHGDHDRTEQLGPYPSNTEISGTLPGAGAGSMALKGSRTFQARSPYGANNPLLEKPATWTETWDLQPVYSDTPDKKEVEDPCLVSGSIIGCENQALGETIPLAGTPYRLHYQSNRTAGTTGANAVAIAYAQDLGGWTLNVQHRFDPATNRLYMGNGAFLSSESIGTVTPTADSGFLIASENGQLVHEFNASGLHSKTLHALTGEPLLTFNYDVSGRLVNITDGDSNMTTFTRKAQGKLAAIVSPYGHVSQVTLSKDGYITALKDPAGKSIKAKYSGNGLLTAFTNVRGMTSRFSYDANGLLVQDQDPAGGKQTFVRNTSGDTVTRTTPMGRTTDFQTVEQSNGDISRTLTEPSGLARTLGRSAQLSEALTTSNGSQINMTPGIDARFGLSARIPETVTLTTPGGISKNIASARVNTLTDPANPFSLSQQTETLTINGKAFSSLFDASAQTITETTPLGRQSVFALDNLGRVTGEQVAGLNSVEYSYDSHGRLSGIFTGSGNDVRTLQLTYDSLGYLQALNAPLAQNQSFIRDKLGRVVQQTLPDGNKLKFAYDAGGNLLKLTNPARKSYGFSYGKTGLLSMITLPAAKGAKNKQAYTYNPDGQLTGVSRLDRTKLAYAYDASGRLNALSAPGKTWAFGYDPAHGYLNSITEPGGIQLSLSRDGNLLQQLAWSGAISGQVDFTYNNDFQHQTIMVNHANPISYQYDQDGLLSQAGALSIQRNSQNRLRTGSVLGGVRDSFTNNGFGEVTHYQADFNTTSLLSIDYTYDALNRITQIVESLEGGGAKTYHYAYDVAGHLINVREGAHTHTYSYDKTGNRLSFTSNTDPSTNANGRYDAQDRMLNYGGRQYGYTLNGEINRVLQNNQTTQYEYNPLGNLTAAVLPSGERIEYLVDGNGMRVAKKKGAAQQIFLYQDNLKPIAELDGSGNLLSRFVYANQINVPDYMIREGHTYRIITDHVGSPRLIVNAADGSIAQRLDYDEFGNVLQDTAPGFQPFGFAGGLYDTDTQLIHYGAREFDPKTGRWISRDPVLFSGGALNTYANLNDPLNTVDPTGRDGWFSMDSISSFIRSKFSSVKAGPVSISTDAPKVSIGASQDVAVGDVSLINVSAEASVEVITTGGAADELVRGKASIGAKQPFLSKIPGIGWIFCDKVEVEVTAKAAENTVEKMGSVNRAWKAFDY